jgi:hypothetical protein
MSHASPLETQLRPSVLRGRYGAHASLAQPLFGGLRDEIERQEREDNEQGPEAEQCGAVTRLVLPVGYEWAAAPAKPGADELRVRALLIQAGVRL